MKKVFFIIWGIFGIVFMVTIGIIGYQNQTYFLSKHRLNVELNLSEKHQYHIQTPEWPNANFWLICVTIGFLIASFLNLSKQFQANREIKQLMNTIQSLEKNGAELKAEVERLNQAVEK